VENSYFKGRNCRQKQSFFMHLSVFRFWAFWLFIKCFFRLMERKHPKHSVNCFFYSTLSICVNRCQLQDIFLKAVFSKWVFSLTLSHKSQLQWHLHTHQTIHIYSCLYSEGFYRGICSYIIFLIIYNILFPPKMVKIYCFPAVQSIFWIMEWQEEIPRIPSVKTFDSNMSKKIKQEFMNWLHPVFRFFCTRNVCKLVHNSLNNASFAYWNITF